MDTMEYKIKEILSIISNSRDRRIDYLLKPCFVCCDESDVSLTLKYNVQDWQLNHFDTMHGGMISTLFDNCLGCLAHYIGYNQLITTSSLTTNYLKPVPANSEVYIKASAVSVGKTLIHLRAEAYVGNNEKIVASSTGIFMIIKKSLAEMAQ